MAEIDIGQITEALNDKTDRDMRNVDTTAGGDAVIEYQEPTADNGYTWYRKYKSGWVEQGGHKDDTSTGYQSVTLPVEMANAHFDLHVSRKTGAGTSVVNVWGQNPMYSGSTTTITFYASNTTGVFWRVSGMAAN